MRAVLWVLIGLAVLVLAVAVAYPVVSAPQVPFEFGPKQGEHTFPIAGTLRVCS